MADDRIQLNLVLNEATVSAVEGRVRNLVNRLNNTNISLNIDARNLNNIENQFNRIQQQMQTINATPVNINANLTSAQQQYRLETERMRVSQQLELSRQRTLQTENQAISALAQQNRTLTVNNNITHQIEQGAQNIGNNMNVAGGHARDFVDYLADGVRYIIVYRSLYEIMNQVGEAFSEMKNVDKELISVRKTTGMAENEIEKIRKASYGVATEYGRTASEYLGSVSEFARGGYKELSTELAKVSLLTQNVGDVSADSANKMLLSVDAAYKLKGNVAELTNVVNGLNNIANLNPTSMQKMADGIQVSASMAKVAGLEISDLVALIGTGTAVTQREGGEVARAVRTALMNIRQVKGELEDGTVIDSDSIAKAEKALNGVGIETKEVVNGIRELRDPMLILEELSQKWSTLNSEAQSLVLEGIGNKRQANLVAAIIENWDMVGKMQNEYLNSANSAIKENELYLQGWEATQNKVSAKWTEFIANMADTALITGSLKALYDVLVVLDTPIGRIATSIVLVNTALAVSNRLWQAIRARSIVADILSMGVAERNLGTAIQLVSGHLGRQALAWATSPLGMATIAVAGITLITSAIEKNSQKLEENAQKAGEAYDKVKSNMNELDSFIKQYNDLQISNEWNNTSVETKKQLHEDINRLLGDEANTIDILNGKYKETTEELFKQRMAKLSNGEEAKSAFDNEQAKGKTLWDTVWWNNGTHTSYTSILSDEEEKSLDKYSHIFTSDHTTANGEDVHNYQLKFDNFHDFLYKYDEVKKLLQDMYNEGLGETETYKKLNDFIAKFDAKVNDYKTAVEELEKTKAGQKLGNYITQNVGGYIDDLEEYNKVVDWVKSNFAGEDKKSALTFLNSYFSEYADKVAETSDLLSGDYSSAIKSVSATLSTLQDKYDELKSAQEEYNSTGAISAETMQKLIDNDLLQYLDYSSGKLRINTDALLAEGEAAKVNAIQKLQDAMATDLMNLATGKTDQLSNTAKTAIANLGSAAETTGDKAQTAASKLAGFAIAAQAAKDGAEGNLTGMSVEEFNTQANAIISAYTSAANSIGGITIKSPKTSRSKGSSSDKNEALDNYLKYAEDLYKVHQDELKYIHDLQWGYDNLTKTDEERLEIAQDIEEARKNYAENRIKDIEHEIGLLQNLHGEETDVLDYYRKIQAIAHEEADRLRALGYDDNSNEVQEWQNKWWDYEKQKLEWRVNHSQNWIDERERLGDWQLWGDSEVDAWERVVKWLNEEYPHAIDEIKEAEEKLFDARKKQLEDALNLESSKLGSQKTLLQSHYDITNSIAEAQHEINKELEASKTMYEYLDEDTRKLLFNQEDYNILSSKLLGIQAEANALQDRYNNDILSATAENLDEITSKYEMQYETLMKSYEIAKADLEIAKKKQKLDNVLAEKNVKMLINGQWTWVANTQDVIDAQSELADAEYARQTAAAGLRQTNSLNDLTAQQDKLGTVMNKLEKGILSAVDSISMLPVAIQDAFLKLQSATLSASNTNNNNSSGRVGSGLSADYVSWAKAQMDANSAAWHGASPAEKTALEKANQSLGAAIGSTYDSASGTWKHKYATGTKHTQPGSALMGEIEPEMYVDNNGYLIPINQPTLFNDIGAGGIVFNQAQMENMRNLWDLSNVNTSNISSILTDRVATSDRRGGDGNHFYGDITVNNPQNLNEFVREVTNAFKRRTVN